MTSLKKSKIELLEDRILQLECLTLPEQLDPNKLLVIKDSKDSLIGGLLETQTTLKNLGCEHRKLELFLSKYQEIEDFLIPAQMHQAFLDIDAMKGIVASSFHELEFLMKQLESVNELKHVVDFKFEQVQSQQRQVDELFRNSPKELIMKNHSEYLNLLQENFIYIQNLSRIFLSLSDNKAKTTK